MLRLDVITSSHRDLLSLTRRLHNKQMYQTAGQSTNRLKLWKKCVNVYITIGSPLLVFECSVPGCGTTLFLVRSTRRDILHTGNNTKHWQRINNTVIIHNTKGYVAALWMCLKILFLKLYSPATIYSITHVRHLWSCHYILWSCHYSRISFHYHVI